MSYGIVQGYMSYGTVQGYMSCGIVQGYMSYGIVQGRRRESHSWLSSPRKVQGYARRPGDSRNCWAYVSNVFLVPLR